MPVDGNRALLPNVWSLRRCTHSRCNRRRSNCAASPNWAQTLSLSFATAPPRGWMEQIRADRRRDPELL